MANDWDLYAVVRSCAAATRSTNLALPTFPLNQPEIHQDPPSPPPTAAVMPAPVYQPQLEMEQQFQVNMQRFPVAIPQHIRPRRRKNQQTKLVRQMTQEELSADSWAWRKYGQKPIKGSPYPRNYYRCSTSKGCAARKQVERSPTEDGIFVVSFTGEHTHARPTHRSSLSGSTRTKFVPKNNSNNALLLDRAACTASSSTSSLSPATPSMADEENAAAATINDDDIIDGFEDSDGGGDYFTGGLMSSPPWSPGTAAAFNGGGIC